VDCLRIVPDEKDYHFVNENFVRSHELALRHKENEHVESGATRTGWSNYRSSSYGTNVKWFAAWDNYTAERIDEVVQMNVDARGDSPTLRGYYDFLKANYLPRDPEINYAHAARQAYIAVGFALMAAAEQEVDSTPMEGFDPDAVDTILGLRERGLRSVVLMPLGYRDHEGDWLLPMAKVRKSRAAIVTELA
jgi:nitroreductase / dihydropteridine reductase